MPARSNDKPAPVPTDPGKRRSVPAKDDQELNADAQALLALIEETVRPAKLAAKFPRIVNRMAALWQTPRKMNRYFDQLLDTTRGGRQGLPLDILMEIATLKDYYRTKVFPVPHDVWDAAEESKGRNF